MTDFRDVLEFLAPDNTRLLEMLLLLIASGIVLAYVFDIIRALWRLMRLAFFENFFSRWARPFQAPHPTGDKHILIAGDSTAVGAGASRGEDTIAGRLGHDYPQVDIVNIGINGALTRQVVEAMDAVKDQHFELSIVSVGGNDIWHFTNLKKLRVSLTELLTKVKNVSRGPVILLLYNNVASAVTMFPSFMSYAIQNRNEKVAALFKEVAEHEGVACIELFSKDEDNPFLTDPHTLFASDGVHPSSEGYRRWYHRMWRLLVARGFTL